MIVHIQKMCQLNKITFMGYWYIRNIYNKDYYYLILLLFCSVWLKNELTIDLEGRSGKLGLF